MAKINADERRSPRARVMLTAMIECDGIRTSVRIDDLSAYGVRVLGDGLPEIDTPVNFECNGLSIQAFVAWVKPPLAGIGFGEPVEPRDVLRKIARPRQIAPTDFRRPGFQGRQLTDAERQIVQRWNGGSGTRLGE